MTLPQLAVQEFECENPSSIFLAFRRLTFRYIHNFIDVIFE